MQNEAEEPRSRSYWQEKLNGKRHYVDGTGWLLKHAKSVRLLEVFPISTNQTGLRAKLIAYMEGGKVYSTRFDKYEDASNFVTQTVFDGTNKEIHSK